MLTIGEVDLDVRGHAETLVAGHLRASITSQRLVEFLRQLAGVLGQSVDDSLGILARDLHKHHEPGLAFDQRRNLAVGATEQ